MPRCTYHNFPPERWFWSLYMFLPLNWRLKSRQHRGMNFTRHVPKNQFDTVRICGLTHVVCLMLLAVRNVNQLQVDIRPRYAISTCFGSASYAVISDEICMKHYHQFFGRHIIIKLVVGSGDTGFSFEQPMMLINASWFSSSIFDVLDVFCEPRSDTSSGGILTIRWSSSIFPSEAHFYTWFGRIKQPILPPTTYSASNFTWEASCHGAHGGASYHVSF